MKNYIIAIGREFGSGGKAIGVMLSERLGIPCYEQEILTMASEYSGINESLFSVNDEKLSGSHILRYLKGEPSSYMVAPSDKDFVSDANLFNIQAHIIKELAANTSCIIVGKCANYVLQDHDNVVSAFITAPMDYMIDSIMELMPVDRKEAERLIKRTNKYRSEYYKYYTKGLAWKDPLHFDMVLNSYTLTREGCADIIQSVVEKRFF